MDPLKGKPKCKSHGIRYYNSWTLEFKSILEIKGLKQIDILSITSYLLLSNFDQQIEESINKGKIGFLTSTSRISICKDSKKQNFREK